MAESYSIKNQKKFRNARRTLPRESLLALGDIADKLADNPDPKLHRHHIEEMEGIEHVFVYSDRQHDLNILYKVDHEKKEIHFLGLLASGVAPKKLFISYSHEDKKWLDKIEEFLMVSEKLGVLDIST